MASTNYLLSIIQHKCPRCRQGDLFIHSNPYAFKGVLLMPTNCAVCGQKTELETGFYFGTGYVSYALSIAFTVATFIAWYVFFGFGLEDYRVFYWLGTNILLLFLIQPYMMRLSRTIWLSFFVSYDPTCLLKKI